MKELSLSEIQGVSLDILKHLHSFCQEHGIKYSLGYGSLIGAIRHHGFIPWDDDLDVVMMRDDFERFCSIYEDSPEYKLYTFNRGNMYAAMGRLCEMQKTSVNTGAPLFTEQTGLWIDIFPLDSVDNERSVFESKVDPIKEIHSKVLKNRYRLRPFPGILHLKSLLHWVLERVFVRIDISEVVEDLKEQNRRCVSFASPDSRMMSLLVFPVYIDRDFSPKSVFEDVIEAPFEDGHFCIMKGYDEWLRNIYGDYMQLPPKNKQVRGHSIHKYYWK